MEEKKNLSISGSGHLTAGEYGTVRISGGAHSDGDIRVESLNISGGAKLKNIHIERLHVSGSANIDGDITGGEAHVSGGMRVGGQIDLRDLHVSGSLRTDGCVRGVSGQVSGGFTAEAGAEFETLKLTGALHVKGLLNAEKLNITVNGTSEVDEIGGDEINIKRAEVSRVASGILGSLFNIRPSGKLKCSSIEGTNVYLEDTICDVVRGKRVYIGDGCDIGRVEYAESIEVAGDARVGEQEQV